MKRVAIGSVLGLAALLLLALAWWGWHEGGLALMQLGMGVC
ncbi:hypothetical protein ACIOVF_17735 [Pseudomonas sp. NPDC087612]|nr:MULTISPECIES: hypothetical protein [unclassified Pseudomonas]SDQ47285.1 hypothetical protein SAMN05216487_2016 [Pseudomonas sp. UC 17F4]